MRPSLHRLVSFFMLGTLILPVSAFAADATPQEMFRAIDARGVARSVEQRFEGLRPKLDQSLTSLVGMSALPETTINPVGSSKRSTRNDINKMLRSAVDLLSDSTLTDLKSLAERLTVQNKELRESVATARFARVGAPETKRSYQITTTTQGEYDRQIRQSETTISSNEDALREIERRMVQEFRRQNVNLSAEQVRALMASVSGNDDVQVFASIEAVKSITELLRKTIVDQGETAEVAKRYFGMHVLLLRAVVVVQQDYVDRIDKEYLPALKAIEDRTNVRLRDSAAKQKDTSTLPDIKAEYAKNDASDRVTLAALGAYRAHLERNKTKLQNALKPLTQQYDLAEARFFQASDSAALLNMMRTADSRMTELLNLAAPPLLSFQNTEVETEFNKITAQISVRR